MPSVDCNEPRDERLYLEQFLEIADVQPAEIRRGCPVPDYILTLSTGPTGVEITQLFHPPPKEGRPPQVYESHADMVMDSAKKMWDDAGGPPAHVSVVLHSQLGTTRRKVNQLANRLAQLVTETFEPDRAARVDWSWEKRERMPREFQSVLVHPNRVSERSTFSGGHAMMVPDLSESLVADALAAKERKLTQYREAVESVWLLLVAHSFRGSGMFDDMRAAFATSYDFNFDRVFVLRTFEAEVFELNPSNKR